MSVTIITGSIGAGKTRYCLEQMKNAHRANPDRRCIMLVPSHYSHITEQLLINEFGGTGLNNIECLSIEKLAQQLLSDAKPTLGASGKYVLISRAIKLYLDELRNKTDFDPRLLRSASRRGFVDICASLMSELNHYCVSSEELLKEAQKCSDKHLAQKLTILAGIEGKYRELLENTEYRDRDDDIRRLAPIVSNHFTKDDIIWIDKFDSFLPEQADVIKAIISCGCDITFAFSVCPDIDDTYYGTLRAIETISEFCEVRKLHLTDEMTHITVPDLKFLFSNWHNSKAYPDKVNNAQIFAARDSYTEIEHTAGKILDLVREEGYRYSDIGIICANPQGYSHILEAIFDEYGIPYYTDDTVAISEHPIAMQILSLFDIIENNWDYSSVFRYLRSGFIYCKAENNRYKHLDADDIDLLENYVLKYGIERKGAWSRSWAKGEQGVIDTAFRNEKKDSIDFNYIDSIREFVTAAPLSYSEAVKSSQTAVEFCHALVEFLGNINLYSGLKGETLAMAHNDASADTERFAQIWNLILDIINQAATALGDTQITHAEFADCIRIAMSQCQIRTIPSGVDRVFVGSTDMNRALPTKVIFAIGAVSGTFPTATTSEGYFSNAEREYLSENKLYLAPTTVKKTEKLRNIIYKLLSAVTEKLYISYPTMTADGKTTLPSQTVTDIKNKLPRIIQLDDAIADNDDTLYLSSPTATLHKRMINPAEHPLWSIVDKWFSEHEQWRSKLLRIDRAKKNYTLRRIKLKPALATELYRGKIRYSATRLNSYAQCPFSHFMQYGLRAREQEKYEISAADTGTYAHEIIRRLCDRLDTDPDVSWTTITNEQCDTIVADIVADTVLNIEASDLSDREITADILKRMGKAVSAAAKTAVRSIACGDFKTAAYEKEVYIPIGEDIEVGGIIDRLDVCSHDGINEYRIIDYKTGNKQFKPAHIYNGIDMQPVIYAYAMRHLDNSARISGMYYSRINNDFQNIEATSKDATALSHLEGNTAYAGVTFANKDDEGNFAEDDISRVESELSRSDGSLFFTVKNDRVVGDTKLKSYTDGENLMAHVQNKIIETDKEIKSGNIAISPLDGVGLTPCTYCAYSSVCKFDEASICHREIKEKDPEIWKILEEDE